jgi:DNA mismatch repair protein MutS2
MEFMNEHSSISLDMEYVFNMISPKTPYGIQKKREIKPYKIGEEVSLEKDYDETQNLIKLMEDYPEEFNLLSQILYDIKEIRQSLRRAAEGLVLDEVELFEIKNFLFNIKDLLDIQNRINRFSEDILLYRCLGIEELLDPEKQNTRTFYIYDTYTEELSRIRKAKRELQQEFDKERKRITQLVEQKLGTKLKLSGEVLILKKDEDKLKKARECPYLIEGASTMLQVTFKLKQDDIQSRLAEDIENIKHEESSEEYRIKKHLSIKISEEVNNLYELTERLGTLDFFMARAKFAVSIGGIRPILHCHDKIIIKNGRHLKLDAVLSKKGMAFCPISFEVEKGVTIITGANMGGKTVSLKLAGMLTAIAQYGLFVPAEEFKTCLFDYIYFSIGDMQSIDSGLSTFGSEISGMIEILKFSNYKGLILIDELARGTNPEEGYAISRAIVKFLKTSNAITLFTTHFDGITSEGGIKHLQVKGLKTLDFNKLNAELKDTTGGIELVLKHMDYSLEVVTTNYEVPKDAINIARLMGLDEDILDFAEKIMSEGKGDNNGKVKS